MNKECVRVCNVGVDSTVSYSISQHWYSESDFDLVELARTPLVETFNHTDKQMTDHARTVGTTVSCIL